MSNKTQLQTNNTALDGYIARINAAKEVAAGLPESGGSGGGSVETCTVTIIDDMAMDIPTFYYTDATMASKSITTASASLTVPINTIIAITQWSSMYSTSGACSQIYYHQTYSAYLITGDCTFTVCM